MSADSNPWHLKPVYRCQGQTAQDYCLRYYNTHKHSAYSLQDLSKILDDIRGIDKEIEWLVNTRGGTITSWEVLKETVARVQRTIAQAVQRAFGIKCIPDLHADYGISLVNQIRECYDWVSKH